MAVSLIAIDPGYATRGHGCACVCLRDEFLAAAWFQRSETFDARLCPHVDIVLWEKPQWDGRSKDGSMLIELTAAGATLAGLYAGQCGAQLVAQTPAKWKGSQHKPCMHANLWDALHIAEQALLGGEVTRRHIEAACEEGARERWKPGKSYYPGAWLVHNLLDAAAMAMVYVGRMAR